jgi:hypothetical protein
MDKLTPKERKRIQDKTIFVCFYWRHYSGICTCAKYEQRYLEFNTKYRKTF